MAERRMFARSVIESDKFIVLPLEEQGLYFHLVMNADNEGVVRNAFATALYCEVEDTLLLDLCEEGFLKELPSGNFQIVHWDQHTGRGETVRKRNSYKYRMWRKAIIERDMRCTKCGSTKHLEAHHIKPFASYPDLRFDLGNGITLCRSCHRKLHGLEKKNGEEKNV